jgi:hypothetical protein
VLLLLLHSRLTAFNFIDLGGWVCVCGWVGVWGGAGGRADVRADVRACVRACVVGGVSERVVVIVMS